MSPLAAPANLNIRVFTQSGSRTDIALAAATGECDPLSGVILREQTEAMSIPG